MSKRDLDYTGLKLNFAQVMSFSGPWKINLLPGTDVAQNNEFLQQYDAIYMMLLYDMIIYDRLIYNLLAIAFCNFDIIY